MAYSQAHIHKIETDPAVFDVVQFRRYTMDNRDLEIEIVGLFRGQLGSLARQLRGALDAYDWKLAAHTLKGSARAVGATRIAELATELELATSANAADLLDQLDNSITIFEGAADSLYA